MHETFCIYAIREWDNFSDAGDLAYASIIG